MSIDTHRGTKLNKEWIFQHSDGPQLRLCIYSWGCGQPLRHRQQQDKRILTKQYVVS